MACIPGPVSVPDVTATLSAMLPATTAQQIATDQSIAAGETAQETAAQAKQQAQWIKEIQQWVERKQKWISDKTARIQEQIKKFADRKARFMVRMSKFIAMFNKTMMMIAKFMPVIKVMLIIIMIFTNFLQYVMMFLAAIAISLLYVLAKILSTPGIAYIPAAIYWFIVDFLPFCVFCVVNIAIIAFVAVVIAILTAINAITNGLIQDMIFCENTPASWYKRENWHYDNKYKRGVFCSKPCKKGYRPDVDDAYCMKNDVEAPDFCPQAQVMRIWTGTKNDKKVSYVDFNDKSGMKYRMKMPEERERMIKDYFLKRKKFFETCDDKMRPYNRITMSICSNLDMIEKNGMNGLKKEDVARLRKVCNQAFCTPGKSFPFCTALNNNTSTDEDNLLQLIVKFALALLVFLIVFVTFMRIMQKNMEE